LTKYREKGKHERFTQSIAADSKTLREIFGNQKGYDLFRKGGSLAERGRSSRRCHPLENQPSANKRRWVQGRVREKQQEGVLAERDRQTELSIRSRIVQRTY